MNPPRGKILVIRGGAIGDFILTLPAIAALRKQFPGAHLEVLGYPHIVQLAVAGGLVDRVQSIEARALAGFFARGGNIDPDLSDYFSEFDVIVSYLYDPDDIFRTNVSFCSLAQFIVGPHRPDARSSISASRTFLKPLERLAIFEADPMPRLALAAQPPRRNQIALHPGSGGDRKNWPENRWAGLLQHLVRESPLNFLLVGGEAEGGRLQRLAANMPPARTRLAQSLPLPELALQLQSSAGFVGHDSGISHLAAALGVPSILLWGDTDEAIWRPPHEHVSVIRGSHGLESITVENVANQIGRVFPG